MEVSVVVPQELGDSELAHWRGLQDDHFVLSSPFLSPEFAQAVGHARQDARVSLISDGGAVLGFFAFQRGADALGAPIGASICDAQAPIAPLATEVDPGWLVKASGLSAWRFDHLRTELPAFRPFHSAVHRSPVIDLSAGHEAFLKQLRTVSKDVLAQVPRRRRKLAREVGPVVTEWSAPSTEAFAALVAWKSQQYRATGTWDRFAEPWIRSVLETLLATETPSCAGRLATTRAGDRLAAVHLGLEGPSGLSWWFPSYDPELGSYSPGLIMLLDLAELAAERRLPMIDLGRGEHGYKLRVATGAYSVAEGQVPAA